MKYYKKVINEIEIKFLKVKIAVRYDEDDIPNDFPFRVGDMWEAVIDLDLHTVVDWPAGKTGRLSMKVCDEGCYELLTEDGRSISKLDNDYVPNRLLPGEYGDYIDLEIDENGVITNWLRKAMLEDFDEDFNYE